MEFGGGWLPLRLRMCYNSYQAGQTVLAHRLPLANARRPLAPGMTWAHFMPAQRPYDIREVTGGESLISELTGVMSEDYKESLRQVVATGSLPDYLQLPSAGEAELITIGDLADTGENEDAEQFIDQKALRKVLIGRYGIARATLKGVEACKLGLPIQLCYRRPPYTENLLAPVISSGRHRLLAIQALLLASGISDSEVRATKVRVVTVVVADDKQFSQLMENNNTSRNQSAHELKVHNLSSYGIPTNDLESMLEFAHKATTVSLKGDFFGQAVALAVRGNGDPNFAFNVGKSAWNLVRKSVKDAGADPKFIGELFDNTRDLGSLAEVIANAIPAAVEDCQRNALVRSIATPVARVLAVKLAREVGVASPEFASVEEEARVRLVKQQEAVSRLEELLKR